KLLDEKCTDIIMLAKERDNWNQKCEDEELKVKTLENLVRVRDSQITKEKNAVEAKVSKKGRLTYSLLICTTSSYAFQKRECYYSGFRNSKNNEIFEDFEAN